MKKKAVILGFGPWLTQAISDMEARVIEIAEEVRPKLEEAAQIQDVLIRLRGGEKAKSAEFKPKKSLHWTQRPENRKKMKANLVKALKAKHQIKSVNWKS